MLYKGNTVKNEKIQHVTFALYDEICSTLSDTFVKINTNIIKVKDKFYMFCVIFIRFNQT